MYKRKRIKHNTMLRILSSSMLPQYMHIKPLVVKIVCYAFDSENQIWKVKISQSAFILFVLIRWIYNPYARSLKSVDDAINTVKRLYFDERFDNPAIPSCKSECTICQELIFLLWKMYLHIRIRNCESLHLRNAKIH